MGDKDFRETLCFDSTRFNEVKIYISLGALSFLLDLRLIIGVLPISFCSLNDVSLAFDRVVFNGTVFNNLILKNIIFNKLIFD